MKYFIGVVSAATVFITSALVFAQTTQPATGPAVGQVTVDAAMERIDPKAKELLAQRKKLQEAVAAAKKAGDKPDAKPAEAKPAAK